MSYSMRSAVKTTLAAVNQNLNDKTILNGNETAGMITTPVAARFNRNRLGHSLTRHQRMFVEKWPSVL